MPRFFFELFHSGEVYRDARGVILNNVGDAKHSLVRRCEKIRRQRDAERRAEIAKIGGEESIAHDSWPILGLKFFLSKIEKIDEIVDGVTQFVKLAVRRRIGLHLTFLALAKLSTLARRSNFKLETPLNPGRSTSR